MNERTSQGDSTQIYFHLHHIVQNVPEFELRVTNVKFLESKLSAVFRKLDFQSIAIRNWDDVEKSLEIYPEVSILPKIDRNQDNSKGWIPGELGIWFSNYGAARAFNEVSMNPGDICLLFEDDVWLNVDQGGVLELIPQWIDLLPTNWDYFNLFVIEPERSHYDLIKHGNINNTHSQNFSRTCAVAIAWSKKGIKKLGELAHSGINNPFDIQVFSTPELNGFTLLPNKQGGVSYFSELQYMAYSTIRSSDIRFDNL